MLAVPAKVAKQNIIRAFHLCPAFSDDSIWIRDGLESFMSVGF
jgi:hypothetical protein